MKMYKSLLASSVLLASAAANAAVIGSLGGDLLPFATLASATPGVANTGGTLSGVVAGTIAGGAVYTADMSFADDVVPGETFLAAGTTPGNTATLTLTTPVSYISFLWGSPDLYNTLTVNSTGSGPNSQTFTVTSLLFPVTNGDQSFNQAVQFTAVAGSLITSLVFNSTQDSFEVGRFSVTTAVPKAESYAMMLAGLGLMGFIGSRRKKTQQ